MPQRLAAIFPYAMAAALPLVGLLFAVTWAADGRGREAVGIAAAAVLGTAIYAILLLG